MLGGQIEQEESQQMRNQINFQKLLVVAIDRLICLLLQCLTTRMSIQIGQLVTGTTGSKDAQRQLDPNADQDS